MQPHYLAPEAVATRLGVDRTTVWRWIKDGKLPAFRPGRNVTRISEVDLDAFITRFTDAQPASFVASSASATPVDMTSILQRQKPGRKAKRA